MTYQRNPARNTLNKTLKSNLIYSPKATFIRPLVILAILVFSIFSINGCYSSSGPDTVTDNGIDTVQSPASNQNSSLNPNPAPSQQHNSEIIGLFRYNDQASQNQKLISVERGGKVLLWDVNSGSSELLFPFSGTIDAAAYFSQKQLLALSSKRTVFVYDLNQRSLLTQNQRIKAKILAVQFNTDGKALLCAAANGSVYRWRFVDPDSVNSDEYVDDNSEQGTRYARKDLSFERYVGHSSVASAIAYHPYGRVFFSGDWEGNLNAWLTYDTDAHQGRFDTNLFAGLFFTEEVRKIHAQVASNQAIDHILVSPDGQWLFLGLQDGTIEVWEVRGLHKVSQVVAHRGMLYDMALSPDGTKLVSAGRDGKACAWTVTFNPTANTASVIPDPIPAVSPTPALPQVTLEARDQFALTDVTQLTFGSNSVLYAGLRSGKVLVLDLK